MRIWTLSVVATLAACGQDPPTPGALRARLADDLGNVLHEAKAAQDGSTAGLPGAAARLLALQLTHGTTAARLAPSLLPRVPERLGGELASGEGAAGGPDALLRWLEDTVFTDANYLGDGIYRVPPEVACTTTTGVDPDCAHQLDQAQARIRVEQDGAELRFAIQLDADHDEPVSFSLRHDQVALTVDLDDATNALTALAPVFGEQAPNARLSGRATMSLQILGAAHARIALDFDRAIAVAFADQGASLDGTGAVRFASAAAHVLAIELDAAAPLAAADVGLGETSLHVPGDATTPSTDLDLAGATVSASYHDGLVALANVSLGARTATISKDGQPAIALDLNPHDGRTLAATITSDPSGTETLSVSPRLELVQAIDHAALRDAPPVYDVTRVLLDGSLSGADGSDIARVVTGTFSVTTNPAPFGFSATAGQCITSEAVTDATSGQPYTRFTVGGC